MRKMAFERLESRNLMSVVSDAYAVNEDASIVVGVRNGYLANDTDVVSAALVDRPAHGSLIFSDDGSFGYKPDEDFVGQDSFTYQASPSTDGKIATVRLSVWGDRTGIKAVDDYHTTPKNQPLAQSVLENDTSNSRNLYSSLVDRPAHGTVALRTDGSFVYTPHTDYVGEDYFGYRLSPYGVPFGADIGHVFITVIGVNEPPVTNDDAYTIDEDGILTVEANIGVLVNDSDANNDLLLASLSQPPQHGNVWLSEDGGFVYTPNANFFGVDLFAYEALDGQGGKTLATVRINVNPIPDVPVAVDDYWCFDDGLELYPNGALAVGCSEMGVWDNDTDADGDELMASLTSFPELGVLDFNQDGTFIYWCDPAWSGIVTFAYQITDGMHLSNEATVHIKIR